jgi:hypothetical protein
MLQQIKDNDTEVPKHPLKDQMQISKNTRYSSKKLASSTEFGAG